MASRMVKLFQNVVSISPGGGSASQFGMEKDINDFLATPGVSLVDIHLSSNAGSVGERVTHYGLYALVVYERLG